MRMTGRGSCDAISSTTDKKVARKIGNSASIKGQAAMIILQDLLHIKKRLAIKKNRHKGGIKFIVGTAYTVYRSLPTVTASYRCHVQIVLLLVTLSQLVFLSFSHISGNHRLSATESLYNSKNNNE